MHLKVFVKLKKTLKTPSSGQKKTKKPQKTQKNHWAGFFFKNPGFFQPCFADPVPAFHLGDANL